MSSSSNINPINNSAIEYRDVPRSMNHVADDKVFEAFMSVLQHITTHPNEGINDLAQGFKGEVCVLGRESSLSPLHYAIMMENKVALKLLLALGARGNAYNVKVRAMTIDDGKRQEICNPVCKALARGDLDQLEILLDAPGVHLADAPRRAIAEKNTKALAMLLDYTAGKMDDSSVQYGVVVDAIKSALTDKNVSALKQILSHPGLQKSFFPKVPKMDKKSTAIDAKMLKTTLELAGKETVKTLLSTGLVMDSRVPANLVRMEMSQSELDLLEMVFAYSATFSSDADRVDGIFEALKACGKQAKTAFILVEALKSSKVSPDQEREILRWAVQYCSIEGVFTALVKVLNVDVNKNYPYPWSSKTSYLHQAAERGNPIVVKELLDLGANLLARLAPSKEVYSRFSNEFVMQGDDEATALHLAVNACNKEVVSLLVKATLAAEASYADLQDQLGKTPLFYLLDFWNAADYPEMNRDLTVLELLTNRDGAVKVMKAEMTKKEAEKETQPLPTSRPMLSTKDWNHLTILENWAQLKTSFGTLPPLLRSPFYTFLCEKLAPVYIEAQKQKAQTLVIEEL